MGARYIGTNFGDDQNTFLNSATTLFDAVIDYDLGKFDRKFVGNLVRVNATNLFDKHYSRPFKSGYCYTAERRQVSAAELSLVAVVSDFPLSLPCACATAPALPRNLING